MSDLQATVGVVLRRERRRQRLTLKALAERAALSVVYLGEIERGRKYPSALVLERLSEALGLEVPDLLELVAEELRGGAETVPARAVGFQLPGHARGAPHTVIKRIVRSLEPEEAATMAELGAFFLARRQARREPPGS